MLGINQKHLWAAKRGGVIEIEHTPNLGGFWWVLVVLCTSGRVCSASGVREIREIERERRKTKGLDCLLFSMLRPMERTPGNSELKDAEEILVINGTDAPNRCILEKF